MSNFISLADAIALTTNYRKEKENILGPAYKAEDILPVCETFDRASFETLLAQTDCKYIRVYLGMNKDLQVRVIAVGANSKEEDILPAAGAANAANVQDDGGHIVEDGIRCPDICPPSSPLNP